MRLLHLRWVRVPPDRLVPQCHGKVAGAHLGEPDPRHTHDLFDVRHRTWALDLHPQQQLARRVQRPRIALVDVVVP